MTAFMIRFNMQDVSRACSGVKGERDLSIHALIDGDLKAPRKRDDLIHFVLLCTGVENVRPGEMPRGLGYP